MNRLLLNKIILILSTLSAVIGIGFLFGYLITLTYKGYQVYTSLLLPMTL